MSHPPTDSTNGLKRRQDDAASWIGSTAKVGHLLIALIGLAGTAAGFVYGFADRLTRSEEHTLEQARLVQTLRDQQELTVRRIYALELSYAVTAANNAAEHKQINELLDRVQKGQRVDPVAAEWKRQHKP